jgi:predicted dehydrogenase
MLSEELPIKPEPPSDIQARKFLDLLAGKIANPVPISDGIIIMKALDAIYESAATNKEIYLN